MEGEKREREKRERERRFFLFLNVRKIHTHGPWLVQEHNKMFGTKITKYSW